MPMPEVLLEGWCGWQAGGGEGWRRGGRRGVADVSPDRSSSVYLRLRLVSDAYASEGCSCAARPIT